MIKTEIGLMEIGLILFSAALELMEIGLIEIGLKTTFGKQNLQLRRSN